MISVYLLLDFCTKMPEVCTNVFYVLYKFRLKFEQYFKRNLLKPFCSLLNFEFYYPVKRLLLLVTYWY